jgi:hypothetical protein
MSSDGKSCVPDNLIIRQRNKRNAGKIKLSVGPILRNDCSGNFDLIHSGQYLARNAWPFRMARTIELQCSYADEERSTIAVKGRWICVTDVRAWAQFVCSTAVFDSSGARSPDHPANNTCAYQVEPI